MEIGSKAKVISGHYKGKEIEVDRIQIIGHIVGVSGASQFQLDSSQVEATQTVLDFPIEGAEVHTIIKVTASNFDDFIRKQYPDCGDFYVVANEELSNGDERTFIVEKETLSDSDMEDLYDFGINDAKSIYNTQTVLTDLCNRGILPECELTIDCWW